MLEFDKQAHEFGVSAYPSNFPVGKVTTLARASLASTRKDTVSRVHRGLAALLGGEYGLESRWVIGKVLFSPFNYASRSRTKRIKHLK